MQQRIIKMTDTLWELVNAIYEFEYDMDDQGISDQIKRAVKEEERE